MQDLHLVRTRVSQLVSRSQVHLNSCKPCMKRACSNAHHWVCSHMCCCTKWCMCRWGQQGKTTSTAGGGDGLLFWRLQPTHQPCMTVRGMRAGADKPLPCSIPSCTYGYMLNMLCRQPGTMHNHAQSQRTMGP